MMKRKIIPYNSELKEFARQLRNNSTPGEIGLWSSLGNKQMHSFNFHRQKPLLNYIVDFYCAELELVIELDGRYHNFDEKYNRDVKRDEDLIMYQLTVLRFAEQEVMQDLPNLLRTIEAYFYNYKKHTPNPSQEGNDN